MYYLVIELWVYGNVVVCKTAVLEVCGSIFGSGVYFFSETCYISNKKSKFHCRTVIHMRHLRSLVSVLYTGHVKEAETSIKVHVSRAHKM